MSEVISKFGFIIDNRSCIGCHACTVACKSEHNVPLGVNRTWVKYIEDGIFPDSTRSFSVMRCNHCSYAPCVTMCPVTALYKREDGIVDFDNERCIGCKSCTQACPYDALYIDPVSKTAAKCNYCSHRIDIGLLPSCVVACPEQAIIAGDLSDKNSKIAQLLSSKETSVRKPEKGTAPNVFYIDAKAESLEPTLTDRQSYVWSSQDTGVGTNKDKNIEPYEIKRGKAKRTYDVPFKGVMWGNEVVGYMITKAVAAGLILIMAGLNLFGSAVNVQDILYVSIISFIFTALTGVLLVKDLNQPKRFLYIVFRPQFKSWLARGTYIIITFSLALLVLILVCISGNESTAKLILILISPLAVITAVYTAFLFAQAKGRAFWDNKMSIFFMLLHAIILGSIIITFVISMNSKTENQILNLIHVLNLIVTVWLFKGSRVLESEIVSDMILKGKYKFQFWGMVIFIGNVLPVLLLYFFQAGSIVYLASMFIIIGIIISNSLFIKVPQTIPLS